MFTGIVETTATVLKSEGRSLRISGGIPTEELHIGQSLSINGCCLTITKISEKGLSFDVSPETLARTTLGELHPGDLVNVERGMRLNGALDGHLVSGHIDGTGVIASIEKLSGDAERWFIRVDPPSLRWLVEKGSVAIDGISLTVNEVDEGGFSITLIPHTLAITTFGQRKVGDRVNLEFDLLAKYVERLLSFRMSPSVEARS